MISIVDQVYVFLYAIIGGAIAAFFYDILRIKRRAVKTNVIIIGIEDSLYWLVAAVFLFITVYKSNSGEMRGYIFIGNIIGVMLYEAALSKIIINSSMMVINLVKKILLFIFKILSYPFKLVYRIIKIPVCFIFKVIFKISKFFIQKIMGISCKAGRFAKKEIQRIPNIKYKLRKIRKNT